MDSNPTNSTAVTGDRPNGIPPRPGPRAGTGVFCWRSLWRKVWRLAGCVVIAYLVVAVIAMFLENSLIFYPSPYPQGDWRPAGLHFEDISFTAADGTRLHGWYVPHEDARGVVLFCHGNAGNITHRDEILRRLHAIAAVSVFIFDYRGYGRSEGKPSEKGVLADARAAQAWLAAHAGIAENRVILMGESLGGAVAVDMAAHAGARGLILESTFSSLAEVAAYHFPWLPVRSLLHTQLNSVGEIKKYHGPLLQSHGDRDTIVPYQLGRRLFDAANEPKQFVTFPGGDHNDIRGRDYYERIGQFVAGLK